MKSFKTNTATFVVILIVSIFVSARVIQTRVSAHGGLTSEGFTARLSATEPQYLTGEPVVFKCGLLHPNQLASEWVGEGILSRSTRMAVISKNGAGQEYRWDWELAVGAILHQNLQNLESALSEREIKFNLPFDLDSVRRIFPEKGVYDVKVVYTYYPDQMSGQEIQLVSDSIRVNIHEPSGINRTAYDFYQTSVRPALAQGVEPVALAARREFSRRFGESVYAKYNSVQLARLYERAGEYQMAEDELYPISDVDFYHRDDINLALQRLAGKLRRPTARTKYRPQIGTVPNGVWVDRPDIRPNYNVAPIPAPVLVPTPTPTPPIQ